MEVALEALTAQVEIRRGLLKTNDDYLQALTSLYHRTRELDKLVGEYHVLAAPELGILAISTRVARPTESGDPLRGQLRLIRSLLVRRTFSGGMKKAVRIAYASATTPIAH